MYLPFIEPPQDRLSVSLLYKPLSTMHPSPPCPQHTRHCLNDCGALGPLLILCCGVDHGPSSKIEAITLHSFHVPTHGSSQDCLFEACFALLRVWAQTKSPIFSPAFSRLFAEARYALSAGSNFFTLASNSALLYCIAICLDNEERLRWIPCFFRRLSPLLFLSSNVNFIYKKSFPPLGSWSVIRRGPDANPLKYHLCSFHPRSPHLLPSFFHFGSALS